MVFDFFWWRRRAPPSRIFNLRASLNHTGTVTLTWTVPTTRIDWSHLPASQIKGASIYDHRAVIGTVMGAVSTFTTLNLEDGFHTFTVVTNDTSGNSSAYSNTASVTVTTARPSAITNLLAFLNP